MINTALILEADEGFSALLKSALRHQFCGIKIKSPQPSEQWQAEADVDIALVSLEPAYKSSLAIIRQLSQSGCYCIAISAHNHPQPMTTALQAGAKGYILKDHSSTQIVNMLASMESIPPISPSALQWLVNFFHPAKQQDSSNLTTREEEVLNLIAIGAKLPDVATQLGISRYTCAEYVKNIYKKLNISSRAEAALAASRLKII